MGRGRDSWDVNMAFHGSESGKCPCARMDLASTENISESKVVAECQHLRDFLTQALCG